MTIARSLEGRTVTGEPCGSYWGAGRRGPQGRIGGASPASEGPGRAWPREHPAATKNPRSPPHFVRIFDRSVRDHQAKRRPTEFTRADVDGAPVGFGDAPRDRKSEPRTARGPTMGPLLVAIEDRRALALGDAWPRIGDVEHDEAVAGGVLLARHAHAHLASPRGEFE